MNTNQLNTLDIERIINRVRKGAEKYLKQFGLNLDIEIDNDPSYVGMYEHDSVFTGTVKIYLNVLSILNNSEDDDFEPNLIVTIYHEIGHAMMNFIEEIDEVYLSDYELDFFDVFYDDNGVDEEDLVEDFGQSFDSSISTVSVLRNLLDQMLADGFEFN